MTRSASIIEALTREMWGDPFISPFYAAQQVASDLMSMAAEDEDDLTEALLEGVSDQKLAALCDKYSVTAEAVTAVAKMDPTPNGAYLDWLLKNVASGEINPQEDSEKIAETLSAFNTLKGKTTFSGEKDINKLDPPGLWQVVKDNAGATSKKEQVRVAIEKGVAKVADANGHQVYKVSTPEAAAKLFRDTNWCVKDPKYFKNYGGPFYLISSGDKKVALFHQESQQFKLPSDASMGLKKALPLFEAMSAAGLLLPSLKAAIAATISGGHNPVIIGLSLLQWVSPEEAAELLMKREGEEPEDLFSLKALKAMGLKAWEEKVSEVGIDFDRVKRVSVLPLARASGVFRAAVAKDTDEALEYAERTHKRFPEGEPAILTDPLAASLYARYVIDGRWPEAESVIASSPHAAIAYARNIIKGRWPEGETAIASNPHTAFTYAREVIKGRFPEAEPIIIKLNADTYGPSSAVSYAMDIIRGRWPEAEPAIVKDAHNAAKYARNIIQGRWPEAEPVIAKNAEAAYVYAVGVLNARWPEAEPLILTSNYATEYRNAFGIPRTHPRTH